MTNLLIAAVLLGTTLAVDGRVGRLAAGPFRVARVVDRGEGLDPAPPGPDRLPRLASGETEGRHEPRPGDDHGRSAHEGPLPASGHQRSPSTNHWSRWART